VADAVHDRHAAGALDRLRHRPRGAHVVDHLPAGLAREHVLGEERRYEVARHELAAVVDEEAPVGVPVVRHAEIRAFLTRPGDDELAVLGQQRVRLVVRKRPVGIEVAADDVDLGQSLEHGREHHARHPVRRIRDHAQRANLLRVDERQHPVDEPSPDVLRFDRAGGDVPPLAAHRAIADLQQP
jgi:hypothetical protein